MASKTSIKKAKKDNSRRNAVITFCVVLLGYAAIFGLHKVSDFLLGGGISLLIAGLVKIMTTPMKGLEAPSTSDGIVPEKMEDDYARSTVVTGLELLEELRKHRDSIGETAFTRRINDFAAAYGDLLNRVVADHDKASYLRKLNSYYLPTLNKLLQSYREAKGHGATYSDISATRDDLLKTLEQLLGAAKTLQQEMVKLNLETMDIKIEVLEDILRADGYIPDEAEEMMRTSAQEAAAQQAAAQQAKKPAPAVTMEPTSPILQNSSPTATARQMQQGAPVLQVPGLFPDEPQAEDEQSATF